MERAEMVWLNHEAMNGLGHVHDWQVEEGVYRCVCGQAVSRTHDEGEREVQALISTTEWRKQFSDARAVRRR